MALEVLRRVLKCKDRQTSRRCRHILLRRFMTHGQGVDRRSGERYDEAVPDPENCHARMCCS